MEKKLVPLIVSIVLVLLIIAWPIYFFTVSMFSIISLGINELAFFVIIELVLLAILVVLWELYKRHYK